MQPDVERVGEDGVLARGPGHASVPRNRHVASARTESDSQVGSGPVEDPFAAGQGVLDDLLGPEPEGDLALGRLGAVAAVDRLFCLLIEKSPRTVPGAAATPLVAPSIVRTTAIASFPSSTPTTTGPLVMNPIRPSKNGLPWCSA